MEHPLLERDAIEPVLEPVHRGERRAAPPALDWRQLAGALLAVAGLVAVVLAWVGVSGTLRTSAQLSYLTSGGIGGAALVFLGGVCFMSFEHRRDREALAELEARLTRLEDGLAGEFDHLAALIDRRNGNGADR